MINNILGSKTFEIIHKSKIIASYLKVNLKDEMSMGMFDKIITIFANYENIVKEYLVSDLCSNLENIEFWNIIDVKNAYIAPIYDKNNDFSGALLILNPRITTRSTALVQVVAKYFSDYQVKYRIHRDKEKRIELEPLTGFFNKKVTEEKIEIALSKQKKALCI